MYNKQSMASGHFAQGFSQLKLLLLAVLLYLFPLMSHRPIIKKLFESILSETPDRALSGDASDSEDKLKQVGLNPKKIAGMRWTDVDVVTFIVDVRNHATMWLGNDENERAFQHSDFSEYFTGAQRDSKYPKKGVIGADWKNYRAVVAGIGSLSNPMNKNLILGRLWLDSRFVSFWSSKENVLREWKTVMDFLVNMKVDPRKSVYEFVDLPEIELFDEVTRNDAPVGAINEDPDRVFDQRRQARRWHDSDASPFIVDLKLGIGFYIVPSRGDTDRVHADIEQQLVKFRRMPEAYKTGTIPGGLYIRHTDLDDTDATQVNAIGIHSVNELNDYISEVTNTLERGINRENPEFLQGRAWTKPDVVSFWRVKSEVAPSDFESVEPVLTSIGIKADDVAYEFYGSAQLFSPDQLGMDQPVTLSPDERLALMRRQHIDPESKKKLNKGIQKPDKYGGMLPAEYNAKVRTSDGIAKAGEIIKEDPDAIVSDIGKWSFQDSDAYTVIWHPTRNLFFRTRSSNDDADDDTSGYHNGLLTTLWRIGKVFRDGGITTPEEYNEYADVMEYDVQWDAPGGIISVGYGRNARAIDAEGSTSEIVNYCENLVDVSDDSDGDDRFYTRDFRMMYAKLGIMCRWWEDTQVLSFWLNKRDLGRLIKKGALTGLFKHLGITADHVRLNTVEKNSELFSVEDAMKAAGGKSTMSREKELELMRRQHLDANAKRELNKDVELHKHKEFVGYDRVGDGVIKLGSLISEQKPRNST